MAHNFESTVAQVEELRRRQLWLRRRLGAARFVVFLTTVLGPIFLISTLGWSWWSILLCLFLISGLAIPQKYTFPNWSRLARKAQGDWLLASAKISERPPVLLLRSFNSAVTVEPTPTVTLFGTEQPINDASSPAAPKSHLLQIAQYVRSHGPVVAIGIAKRGIAMASRVDVLMFEPGDDTWFDVFKILSESSRAIMVLPGETNSITCEYRSLKSRNLISKVIIVMPPNGIFFHRWRFKMPLGNDNLDVLMGGWNDAQAHFRKLGVFLPAYDPLGLAFTIGADGRVKDRTPLNGSFVYLNYAVEQLVPPGTGDTRPLAETLNRLERFDLTGSNQAVSRTPDS